MDNYKTIPERLENRQAFRGNSLTGLWLGDTYTVISYDTPIAWLKAGGKREVSPDFYSVTTSRHQNIIRRAWGVK